MLHEARFPSGLSGNLRNLIRGRESRGILSFSFLTRSSPRARVSGLSGSSHHRRDYISRVIASLTSPNWARRQWP